MSSYSPFVAQVLLREIGRRVDKGILEMLVYEGGDIRGLADAMEQVGDALRIAKKFKAPDRHGPKSVLPEETLMNYVDDFPTNEYGKQQAERTLSANKEQAVADMWKWLNELGSYVPKEMKA